MDDRRVVGVAGVVVGVGGVVGGVGVAGVVGVGGVGRVVGVGGVGRVGRVVGVVAGVVVGVGGVVGGVGVAGVGCVMGVVGVAGVDRGGRMKVVSGGQTGADRGALYGAIQAGYDVGGWAPLGWRSEDGQIPEDLRQYMQESASTDYTVRTEANVRDSDATLLLHHGKLGPGSKKTVSIALKLKRPIFVLNRSPTSMAPLASRVHATGWAALPGTSWAFEERALADFFKEVGKPADGLVLNVAGPRERHARGIEAETRVFVSAVLRRHLP